MRAVVWRRRGAAAVVVAAMAACAHAPRAQGAEDYASGRLWRVGSGATSPPSYVFGTMHSGDPRALALPAAVGAALSASDTLCVEALPDDPGMAAALAELTYADATTLGAVVAAPLYGAVRDALVERGMPEAKAARLKPWAAFLTLSTPPPGPQVPLDYALWQRARAAGKTLCGVESPAEQIAAFSGLALTDQVVLLAEAVRQQEGLQADYERVIAAYARGDLRAVMAIFSEPADADPVHAAVYARFLTRLLDERNVRMAERLEGRLRAGGVFVAIGAAHLVGERGVLRLLAERGLTVAPAAR